MKIFRDSKNIRFRHGGGGGRGRGGSPAAAQRRGGRGSGGGPGAGQVGEHGRERGPPHQEHPGRRHDTLLSRVTCHALLVTCRTNLTRPWTSSAFPRRRTRQSGGRRCVCMY